MSKLLIVHCLFAVATSTKWEFPQMDVNKAFLHGGLDEEVYMLRPPGYDKVSARRLLSIAQVDL